MDDTAQNAKRFALVRIARTPGYRELIEVLDELAEQARKEAFNSPDDSRAMRLLHEARGATELVTKFKATLQSLTDSPMENA